MELARAQINGGFAAGYEIVPFVQVTRDALGHLTGGSPAEGRLNVGGYSEDKKIEVFGINVALEYIRQMIRLFAVTDEKPTPLSQTYIEQYAVRSPLALVSSNRAGTEETSLPGTMIKLTGQFTQFKSTVQLNLPTIWSAEEGDKINEGTFMNLVKSMAVRISQGHLRAVFSAFRNPEFAEQHNALTGILHRTSAAEEIVSSVLMANGTPNITPQGDIVIVLPMIFKKLGNPKEMDTVYGNLITGMTERVSQNTQVQYYNEQLLREQTVRAPAATVIYPTNDPEKLDTYLVGVGNRKIPVVYNQFIPRGGAMNADKLTSYIFMALAMNSNAMRTRASGIVQNLPTEINAQRMTAILANISELTVAHQARRVVAVNNGGAVGNVPDIAAGDMANLRAMMAFIFAHAEAGRAADLPGANARHRAMPYDTFIDGGGDAMGALATGTGAQENNHTYDAFCHGFKINVLDQLVDAVDAMLTQGSFPGIVAVYQEHAFVTHPAVALLGSAKLRLAYHQAQVGRKTDEINQTHVRQIVTQIAVVPNTLGGLNHIPHAYVSADCTYRKRKASKVHYRLVMQDLAADAEDQQREIADILENVMTNGGYMEGDFIALGFVYTHDSTVVPGVRPYRIKAAEMFGAPSIFQTNDPDVVGASIFGRSVYSFQELFTGQQQVEDSTEQFTYPTCQLLPVCRGSEDPRFPEGTLAHTYNTRVIGRDRQTKNQLRGTQV